MSNDDIADALGTTFIEDANLNEIQDVEEVGQSEMALPAPIHVDSSLVAVSAVEYDYDNEESVYVKQKLKLITETAGQFFGMVANEFRQAPTAKMAESAGRILDSQVSALNKLADIDENRKKRKDKPKSLITAGGDINVTQNNLVATREQLLTAIKEQQSIDIEAKEIKE